MEAADQIILSQQCLIGRDSVIDGYESGAGLKAPWLMRSHLQSKGREGWHPGKYLEAADYCVKFLAIHTLF